MSANEDVLELLDSLEKESHAKAPRKSSDKPVKKAGGNKQAKKDEEDIMGFLDSLTKTTTNSRRGTPDMGVKDEDKEDSKTQSVADTVNTASVSNAEVTHSSENDKSTNVANSETTTTTTATSSKISPDINPLASITSWWSRNKEGIWDSATQAVKQAEAKVKQHEQSISKFGLSKEMFQSTLSSVLETIAPPISRHEQLKIHIFHDIVGYPAIDTVVYSVFERVMEQVEGGDLEMVVQQGKERHRRGSDASRTKNLNMFRGSSSDAVKLAKANIEMIAVNAETEKLELESQQQNQIRTSNVFLSIQPTTTAVEYGANKAEGKKEEAKTEKEEGKEKEETGGRDPNDDNSTVFEANSNCTFSFVVYLADVANNVEYTAFSQPLPLKWVDWLENPSFENMADPREYVLEWIEEALALCVGVVAQTYVTRRMGCV